MPDETAQQKVDRQTRLSHAMGVMFLQDKVDKLEQDVSKITYPRGVHKTRSTPTSHTPSDAAEAAAAAQQVRAQARAVTGPGITTTAEPATTRNSDDSSKKLATSIRLVDASVLIFSLRSVHNWSRDQSTCVVIPLEAINTLDLLKKGDDPINLAARKATRWLEEKLDASSQDGDAMLTEPVPGIFAQKEHFRVSSSHILKARQARLDQHRSDSTHQSGGVDAAAAAAAEVENDPSSATTKDQFNASEAPRYLRELLSVCLYCHGAASSACNYAVAIAYPPPHLHEAMMEAQSAIHDKPSYLNRTDGRATEAWLDAYQIAYEVVPTSKTWTGEKPSSRFRGEIVGDHHSVGSSDDLVGSMYSSHKGQSRRKASPTPSVSSSTGSFKSELSGLSMLSSHRSPRLRQEPRPVATKAPLRSVRCRSTSAAAASTSNPTTESTAADESELRSESVDEDGPIIARPSSAASSHSFVSSLTTSTQDDWSSQTSFSSHCGTRIVRHAASPTPASAADASSTATPSESLFSASPRLTSRTLHKTRSGAEKMEEYLRRLEAGAAGGGGADRRTESATPTPGALARNG